MTYEVHLRDNDKGMNYPILVEISADQQDPRSVLEILARRITEETDWSLTMTVHEQATS